MKILKQNQYNQGIGKSKLLSSTSGVGAIITTKLGSYVLISDINKWKFIKWANSKIENARTILTEDRAIYNLTEQEILKRGLDFINDQRFIQFIKRDKNLPNLICLIGIPHMTLDEVFNTPNWKKHPIRNALEKSGEPFEHVANDYMVVGTLFPKWFKNKKGEIKKISEWNDIWVKVAKKNNGIPSLSDFAPPRDGNDLINQFIKKNNEGREEVYKEYRPLDQINLILICPNGHLSDIPLSNYLRWKTEKYLHQRPDTDKGEELLSIQQGGSCCGNAKLVWTESKTKSEGYGSIFIHCESCGTGDGGRKLGVKMGDYNNFPKINFEGINSLQPLCTGQKPWEIDINNPNLIPAEKCVKISNSCNKCGKNHYQEHMQIALVTANNVYYANGFSSLYIPMHLATNKSQDLIEALRILEERYFKRNTSLPISKNNFWDSKLGNSFEEFILDNDLKIVNDNDFKEKLKSEFLNVELDDRDDLYEEYRWQEYQCFSGNSTLPDIDINKGLRFVDIQLPNELQQFFKKIQQVEELKVTNVQLDFTRIKPKERIVIDGIVQESVGGKNIFSINPEELFLLPANETLGEGLFFEFSNEQIDKWILENSQSLEERFSKYIMQLPEQNTQGVASKMKLFNNQYKQFLIHSFSHLMMRELEFSCGYPTASLKERLYISRNPEKTMSGVLIYTAEGSEGSMGGLVSQGEPEKILEIIIKSLERAINCSSDPLCWESEGQGIFDLNLAACFSCSLVAETACEEMNLGLDRRILIDEEFGFFRTIL